MLFGEHIKTRRLALSLSLRAFCMEHQEDPSNWSKMERGVLPPPEKNQRLLEIGKHLGYLEDSVEMRDFFDLASASRGELPPDIKENAFVKEKLPLVFRTLRGDSPSEEDLLQLADLIREAHDPHAK